MLEEGIVGNGEVVVTEELTAKTLGSGLLPVYATPAMIALMENTAYMSVADDLDEGYGTVGIRMNVNHVSATPIGMKVTCETKLLTIDERRLVFEVRAYDEVGLIGEGTHERFIINNEKFLKKTESKNGEKE